jgi:hypothetical protein
MKERFNSQILPYELKKHNKQSYFHLVPYFRAILRNGNDVTYTGCFGREDKYVGDNRRGH